MKHKISNKRKDLFSQLPAEIFLRIFDLIATRDLLSCSQVSKRWNKLSNDELLWWRRCTDIKVPEIGDLQGPPLSPSTSRSLKQRYLNHARLISNWESGHHVKPIFVPVHDDHIITGLVISGQQWVASCSDDGSVVVVDLLSGRKLKSFCGHTGGVWSLVALVVDGQHFVATSSTDCTVRLWHLVTGKCVHVLRGHTGAVRCLATSQLEVEGDTHCVRIVSGSRDTTVRIWDAVTGQCVHLLQGHIGAVRCVRADAHRAVSGSYDHSVRVWDLLSGSCLAVLIGHTNRVYTLCLGSRLILSASLDTTMRVWPGAGGACLHVLEGHRSLTSDIAMNSDESLAVSGNADNSIRVWLLSTGECLLRLEGPGQHSSAVTSVQVVLDRFVVSSASDGTVKLWNLRDGEYIRDIVRLEHAAAGAVVWRSMSTSGDLVCAVGSRNGLELSKLMIFRFSVDPLPDATMRC